MVNFPEGPSNKGLAKVIPFTRPSLKQADKPRAPSHPGAPEVQKGPRFTLAATIDQLSSSFRVNSLYGDAPPELARTKSDSAISDPSRIERELEGKYVNELMNLASQDPDALKDLSHQQKDALMKIISRNKNS